MTRNLAQPGVLFDTWLEMLPPAQAASVRALHALVMAAEPRLKPDVKWGNIVYLLDRRALLALTPHKRTVQLQVFAAAALARRFPSLLDSGTGVPQVHFRHSGAMPGDWLKAMVIAACASRTPLAA
jgi:hypothetical protein